MDSITLLCRRCKGTVVHNVSSNGKAMCRVCGYQDKYISELVDVRVELDELRKLNQHATQAAVLDRSSKQLKVKHPHILDEIRRKVDDNLRDEWDHIDGAYFVIDDVLAILDEYRDKGKDETRQEWSKEKFCDSCLHIEEDGLCQVGVIASHELNMTDQRGKVACEFYQSECKVCGALIQSDNSCYPEGFCPGEVHRLCAERNKLLTVLHEGRLLKEVAEGSVCDLLEELAKAKTLLGECLKHVDKTALVNWKSAREHAEDLAHRVREFTEGRK